MIILHDRQQLIERMTAEDMTGARLARQTGVTRQFIHQLTSGMRRSCSLETATKIELSLRVLPGTLFAVDRATAAVA